MAMPLMYAPVWTQNEKKSGGVHGLTTNSRKIDMFCFSLGCGLHRQFVVNHRHLTGFTTAINKLPPQSFSSFIPIFWWSTQALDYILEHCTTTVSHNYWWCISSARAFTNCNVFLLTLRWKLKFWLWKRGVAHDRVGCFWKLSFSPPSQHNSIVYPIRPLFFWAQYYWQSS